MTTQAEVTQTAIIRGILDVTVTAASSEGYKSSVLADDEGITLLNKLVTVSTETTSQPSATTVSTIRTSSTSTTTAAAESTSSSSSSSFANGGILLQGTRSSGHNANVGLVIGIPIAVVGSVLVILAAWYYIRKRRQRVRNADDRFHSSYDEKFNYKISPNQSTSPYNLRSVYQVRAKAAPESQAANSYFASMGAPVVPGIHNKNKSNNSFSQSELSLKDPQTGPVRNSKWNLNTPLSKWFAKHSQSMSSASSRGSLSTAPFSPIVALKEFKLNRSRRDEIDEKSPILPRFPEMTYHPQTYHSTSQSISSKTSNLSHQQVPVDFTKQFSVPKLQPVSHEKKKKKRKHQGKALNDKPLPLKPLFNVSQLTGLEKRVCDRIIPTTPVPDLKKRDNAVYQVIQSYEKNLADELDIEKGEYIKVLARHTDGWCLVEKVDIDGTVLDMSSATYLNDNRGVVPEMCLRKIKS